MDAWLAAAAGQSVSAASSGAVSLASACFAKAASTAGRPSRLVAASGSASSCLSEASAWRLACTPLPGWACTSSEPQAKPDSQTGACAFGALLLPWRNEHQAAPGLHAPPRLGPHLRPTLVSQPEGSACPKCGPLSGALSSATQLCHSGTVPWCCVGLPAVPGAHHACRPCLPINRQVMPC